MPVIVNYAGQVSTLLDNYRKRAQSEARAHRPATDAGRLDSNEAELLSGAQNWMTAECQLYDAVVTETARITNETQQKSIELVTKIDQLLNDGSQLGDTEADLAGERGELVNHTVARMLVETEWRWFRTKHNIHAEADYPESRIWHFALVAFLGLGETLLNAVFYQNDSGLLGGIVVALGVSAVNMGISLGLGMAFRQKNLVPLPNVIAGWAAMIGFVIVAAYSNMLFAAFRSESQTLSGLSTLVEYRTAFANAAKSAGRILYLDPHFEDLVSFILFFVGVILSTVAFWKGYTFDDRHPGYGKIDRRLKVAREAEVKAQTNLRDRLRDRLLRIQSEIKSVLQQPTALIGELGRRSADLQHARQMLSTQCAAIHRDFKLVLDAYRHANAAIRATPAPEYFSVTPQLAGPTEPSDADILLAKVAESQKEIQQLREKHKEALNKRLEQHKCDGAEILTTTWTTFLRDVTVDAENRITMLVPTIGRTANGRPIH